MTTPSDLTDQGAAVLYPDVEHPDPQPLPPDALKVPPPLVQRESNLLGLIRAYASGQAEWPDTKQALIDFDYADPPARYGQPVGPSSGDWYNDVEADIGTSAADDTWAQLQEAVAAGLLTRDERNEVLTARSQQGQQAAADDQAKADAASAKGDPQPTEGKAIKFDPHKHPRGGHGRWAKVKLANAHAMLKDGTEVESVNVDALKPGDVILHPGTEWNEPVVVTKNIGHPRKIDPHMQWRELGLHNGESEDVIGKAHMGDIVDRVKNVPDPTAEDLVPPNAPTAAPLGGSQMDAQVPLRLPRPHRTTQIPNNTPVVHSDGRAGRVRHVTVAELRTGHTLVHPFTGAHAGYVTDVHVRPGGKQVQADDRTPLGMDRFVSVDDEPHGASAMGARYTVFEPFPAGPGPDAAPPDMTQMPTREALEQYVGHHVTLTQSGYHTGSTAMPNRDPISGTLVRVERGPDSAALGSPTTKAVVQDPLTGGEKWMRVTELGSVKLTPRPVAPMENMTTAELLREAESIQRNVPIDVDAAPASMDADTRRYLDLSAEAQRREVVLDEARKVAAALVSDRVDYDTAEGHFLDTFHDPSEAFRDEIMAVLDDAYGK